jgi:hypothetical protein
VSSLPPVEIRKDWWLKAQPFVEIAGVVVLTIYTLFTIQMYYANKKAADAAKSAADTAATQLELSERPWVTVEITLKEPPHAHSPSPGLTFNSDGTASLNVFVVIRNIGHSIAKSIYVRPQMYPPVFDRILTEPVSRQKSWCDKVRTEITVEGQLISLFPGEEDTVNYTLGMGRDDIQAARGSEAFFKTNEIIPIVYGCVNYKSSISSGIHQTPFIYHMTPVPTTIGTVPRSIFEISKLFKGMEPN